MTYLFITLLIINSYLTLFVDWKYFICFLGSIVALILTYKPKEKKKTVSMKEIYNSLPTYHRYVIDSDVKVKDFFGMVLEYHSPQSQGLYDDPEDGVYPLYTYRHLPCKLDADKNNYKVYVETDKVGWQFIGTLFKSSVLDESLALAENVYVEVSGGSVFIAHNGDFHKEWTPLKFTLTIKIRNDQKTADCN